MKKSTRWAEWDKIWHFETRYLTKIYSYPVHLMDSISQESIDEYLDKETYDLYTQTYKLDVKKPQNRTYLFRLIHKKIKKHLINRFYNIIICKNPELLKFVTEYKNKYDIEIKIEENNIDKFDDKFKEFSKLFPITENLETLKMYYRYLFNFFVIKYGAKFRINLKVLKFRDFHFLIGYVISENERLKEFFHNNFECLE